MTEQEVQNYDENQECQDYQGYQENQETQETQEIQENQETQKRQDKQEKVKGFCVDLKLRLTGRYEDFDVFVVYEDAFEKYKNSRYRLEQAMRKIKKRKYLVVWNDEECLRQHFIKIIEHRGNVIRCSVFCLFNEPFVVVVYYGRGKEKDITVFRSKPVDYKNALEKLKKYNITF